MRFEQRGRHDIVMLAHAQVFDFDALHRAQPSGRRGLLEVAFRIFAREVVERFRSERYQRK